MGKPIEVPSWQWLALSAVFTLFAVIGRRLRDGRSQRELWRDAVRNGVNVNLESFWRISGLFAAVLLFVSLWQWITGTRPW